MKLGRLYFTNGLPAMGVVVPVSYVYKLTVYNSLGKACAAPVN
jgi:hypothetical protein